MRMQKEAVASTDKADRGNGDEDKATLAAFTLG